MTLAGIICLIIISPLVVICGFTSLVLITAIIYCVGDLVYKGIKLIVDYVSDKIKQGD